MSANAASPEDDENRIRPGARDPLNRSRRSRPFTGIPKSGGFAIHAGITLLVILNFVSRFR
ncbi:hypothetical protein JW777_00890 [bacterium]|nr:hypothetical protein [bacterium]